MNTLNAESDCKLDKLKTLGVFLLFGAANTLGFLHVSETLGHIGDPPDHFGTIFDNFFSFGAANTLGFLHVSETLGHIGDPPDHFGTIFDNFFSFGLCSLSTNFLEKSCPYSPC